MFTTTVYVSAGEMFYNYWEKVKIICNKEETNCEVWDSFSRWCSPDCSSTLLFSKSSVSSETDCMGFDFWELTLLGDTLWLTSALVTLLLIASFFTLIGDVLWLISALLTQSEEPRESSLLSSSDWFYTFPYKLCDVHMPSYEHCSGESPMSLIVNTCERINNDAWIDLSCT